MILKQQQHRQPEPPDYKFDGSLMALPSILLLGILQIVQEIDELLFLHHFSLATLRGWKKAVVETCFMCDFLVKIN